MTTAERFKLAQDGPRPTEEQLANQREIRARIEDTADAIAMRTAPGREQSLALTKLEEALMWAGRAVFAQPTAPTESKPQSPLAHPIDQDDTDLPKETVGAYLAELLETLLREEESFSGKRPLGNSGWTGYLEDALGTDWFYKLVPAIRERLASA